MKSLVIVALSLVNVVYGFQKSEQIRKLEASGETEEARASLQRAAENRPNDISALTEYAEFLDRYGDPASRQAYGNLLTVLQRSGDNARAAAVARRKAALDLLAGDHAGAEQDLDAYRRISGRTLQLATASAASTSLTVPLAGPLRSFARMAAIPSDISPEDILPALGRNVVTNGYQASRGNEELEQTEYLKLVHRYLSQARELERLAGDKQVIEVPACDAPNAGELLRILGFRMRGGCGSDVVLETVNERRAFITTDSGFPVNELEQALRTNRPFTYPYKPTLIPVMFGPDYWLPAKEAKDKPRDPADFVDAFISDPATCRLYLGFSKLDQETADGLRKASSFARLRAYSNVLDFFGGMFEIRGGKAVVPGGARAASGWTELVGANPDQGGTFFDKMLAKDDGWVASLYDALARIHGPVRDYLVEPAHMKRFYTAIRGRITSPGPARPVFRSNADMMLLTTRLRLDPNGKPHIPGDLDVWKKLFTNHPQGKYDGKLTRLAASWKDPDDVLEALFALCRKAVENEPLKIFMALSDVDRNRTKPLNPATVDRLARAFHTYGSQYAIFSESRELSDNSINQFVDTADAISKIRELDLRSDTAGTFQSLISLWQIFVRQQTLPDSQADATFSAITMPFGTVKNYRELFDAGRNGVKQLLSAVPAGKSTATAAEPHEHIIDLLGGAAANGVEAHDQVMQDIMRILEAQRIISLDTLFQLADHLESISRGEKVNTALVAKLSGRISEIQLPRASLSETEKNTISFGYWTEKHIDAQRRLNLRAAIEKAGADPEKLKDVRGLFAPLLRDTLLAYNYAYYAPPGSQILYTNPVFVRSHDFIGPQGVAHTWRVTEMAGSGWPTSAGGRLIGSLSMLPYALAEAEQNFLVPAQTQALIWGDLVPQMILSAKIPRWWTVTPSQLHWVGLHLRYGRELLAESAFDATLRTDVLDALSALAAPARTQEIGRLLETGDAKSAVEHVTPSELFLLARDISAKQRDDASANGSEIRQLAESDPKEINYEAISRAFGTPKPTLANSYQPELMNLRTFPTLMGYSSRIMAESWESNTLYWAGLADELSLPPAELNVRIPEWTQQLVEHIFASHLEDWPAVLKSLRLVGDDIRSKSRAARASETKATALLQSPSR
jgi:hypothetical protein